MIFKIRLRYGFVGSDRLYRAGFFAFLETGLTFDFENGCYRNRPVCDRNGSFVSFFADI